MLFSIQNSNGRVYEIFEMPGVGMSAEIFAAELGAELHDILGLNGVRDAPLYRAETQTKEPRVVIDIEPCGQAEARIARVHEAIISLIMPPLEEV